MANILLKIQLDMDLMGIGGIVENSNGTFKIGLTSLKSRIGGTYCRIVYLRIRY